MVLSVTDLRNIAASGGGMILDAGALSVTDLRNIAASASGKQTTILLKNLMGKSVTDLRNIAASGNGCVMFDFT